MTNAISQITLNNSVQMPILGFGVVQIPAEQTEQAVTDALASGYRSLDIAVMGAGVRVVHADGRWSSTSSGGRVERSRWSCRLRGDLDHRQDEADRDVERDDRQRQFDGQPSDLPGLCCDLAGAPERLSRL
jgi:hypothetical protein